MGLPRCLQRGPSPAYTWVSDSQCPAVPQRTIPVLEATCGVGPLLRRPTPTQARPPLGFRYTGGSSGEFTPSEQPPPPPRPPTGAIEAENGAVGAGGLSR